MAAGSQHARAAHTAAAVMASAPTEKFGAHSNAPPGASTSRGSAGNASYHPVVPDHHRAPGRQARPDGRRRRAAGR